MKQMQSFVDREQEFERIRVAAFFVSKTADVMIEPVQLLPHFGTDLIAHLTAVFTRRVDRPRDGRAAGRIVEKCARQGGRVALGPRNGGVAEALQNAVPAVLIGD